KFAEHEDTIAVGLTGAILLRHQVQTIAKRSHPGDIGQRIERSQFFAAHALVKIYNRGPMCRCEVAVDFADKFIQLASKSLIVSDTFARRNGNLDEDHLFSEFGVLSQQA